MSADRDAPAPKRQFQAAASNPAQSTQIFPSQVFRFRYPVDVRFRDLDPMGHAHHSMPLIYLEEARAAYWREVAGRTDIDAIDYVMAEVTVRYHARIEFPARLEIALRTSHLGGKSFVQEFEVRLADGTLLASGRTTQVMYDYARNASMPIPAELRDRIESFEQAALSTPAKSPV